MIDLEAIRKRNEERKAAPIPFPDVRQVLNREHWTPRAYEDIDALIAEVEELRASMANIRLARGSGKSRLMAELDKYRIEQAAKDSR